MSFSPTIFQEATQGASERGTRSQSLEVAHDFKVTKQDSNVCQSCENLKPAEADVATQSSYSGPSIWPMDTSNATTSSENTAGFVGKKANRELTEAPSSLEQTDQTESSHKDVEYGRIMDSEGLREGHSSSQPPDTCSDSVIESNTRFSYNSGEITISPTENGVCNVLNGESKALGPHISMGVNETFEDFEEKLADFAEQQLSNQETGLTMVVSTDLDGWQRFDVEENEVNGVFGCDKAIDGKSQQKRELWEQLLEEGSEDSETHFRISASLVEADTSIESSLHGGSQLWLASPGNPFIEGLDRLSSFSEGDHCTANDFMVNSKLLDSFEADKCLPFKEGPFHTDHSSKNFLQAKPVEGNLGSQSNGLYDHGSSGHANPRFPSFSDIRRSSSNSRDPCSMSFMEQLPGCQAGNYVYGIENAGEKWEANFDLMVPATQGGPRSLSLPREAGDTQGRTQKKTFSLFSREAPATSQSRPLGFSSPKLSPIVKKVVSKVWTKPEQVEYPVCHKKSSNTVDKEPKKCIWRCCICCSHVN